MHTNSLQGIFKPRAQAFAWLLEITFVCKLCVCVCLSVCVRMCESAPRL